MPLPPPHGQAVPEPVSEKTNFDKRFRPDLTTGHFRHTWQRQLTPFWGGGHGQFLTLWTRNKFNITFMNYFVKAKLP